MEGELAKKQSYPRHMVIYFVMQTPPIFPDKVALINAALTQSQEKMAELGIKDIHFAIYDPVSVIIQIRCDKQTYLKRWEFIINHLFAGAAKNFGCPPVSSITEESVQKAKTEFKSIERKSKSLIHTFQVTNNQLLPPIHYLTNIYSGRGRWNRTRKLESLPPSPGWCHPRRSNFHQYAFLP